MLRYSHREAAWALVSIFGHDGHALPDPRIAILFFTQEFGNILRTAGVECVKLPIKSECLNKLVPLRERHLRRAVSELVEHYHLERNHQ